MSTTQKTFTLKLDANVGGNPELRSTREQVISRPVYDAVDKPDLDLVEMTMTVEEIRDRYFNDAEPIDDLPGVHSTGLLAPSEDHTTDELALDLYCGWRYESLCPGTLWHCVWQLAVIVYSSQQIYLFTFDDLGSFETHLTEIRACFRHC
jgi:hypothetical protein